ncbi:MAG: recombinase family protein [Clostridia bacterium]|nr:recombinase family protein [Clostridia bacterium]
MEIERTVQVISPDEKKAAEPKKKERRVAGYARVSTDKDEQFTSYASQIEYYTKYICDHEGWSLVKIYSDEGISGTSTKHRAGFRQMIADALDGKIDLIVTKSISRFARNTVDSLTTIRRLKEAGVECFFEKENIYTFDSKGEFLITILSSLAQEESRSLSENVTWGTRRRFADGKYYIHYSEFLGYRRGADGSPEIDPEEASVVRRIFYMCLEENSTYKIAKILTLDGVPTPMGKNVWSSSVVKSILTNERYIGDALLQKTYCTDFLTKKRKKNEGEIPQYYVKNGHPAIISRELFDKAREALASPPPRKAPCVSGFPYRLCCAVCGHLYTETVWHPGTASERRVWRCGKKFKCGNCKTPYFTGEEMKNIFEIAKREIESEDDLRFSLLPSLVTDEKVISAYEAELSELYSFPVLSSRTEELEQTIKSLRKTNEEVATLLTTQDRSHPLLRPENFIEYLSVAPDRTVTAHLKFTGITLTFSI